MTARSDVANYWLTLTHSARELDFDRSSRASLQERFSDHRRLENLEPFAGLNNSSLPSWSNNVSLWEVDLQGSATLHNWMEFDFTVNHAYLRDGEDSLMLCRTDRIEIRTLEGELVAQGSDPWMAGGHTIFPDGDHWIVSCSASDAALKFDSDLVAVDARRLPSALGQNYDLQRDDDVRLHYIANDAQVGHVNCVSVRDDVLLWTCFIGGEIVKTRKFGDLSWFEIVASGFTGCHGARHTHDGSLIYFADTTSGSVIWLNEAGRIVERYETGSIWLHDVQQIAGTLYALSLSDTNELLILDSSDHVVRSRIDLGRFGETALLLAAGILSEPLSI